MLEVDFEFDGEAIEMIAPSWPKISQLRLILIISYLLVTIWAISLYAAENRATFDERIWCADWDRRTESRWVYEKGVGCVRR